MGPVSRKEAPVLSAIKDDQAEYPSSFSKLPAEIRNRIYDDVLFQFRMLRSPCGRWHDAHRKCMNQKGNILVHSRREYSHDNKPRKPPNVIIAPPLLQVNRQFRAEAAPVHYGIHNFTLFVQNDDNFVDLVNWADVLGDHFKLLSSITIQFQVQGEGSFDLSDLLEIMNALSPTCRITAAGRDHLAKTFDNSVTLIRQLQNYGMDYESIENAVRNVDNIMAGTISTHKYYRQGFPEINTGPYLC